MFVSYTGRLCNMYLVYSPAVALFKGTTHLFIQTELQAPQGLSVDSSNTEPFVRQNIYLEYHYSEFVGILPSLRYLP